MSPFLNSYKKIDLYPNISAYNQSWDYNILQRQ